MGDVISSLERYLAAEMESINHAAFSMRIFPKIGAFYDNVYFGRPAGNLMRGISKSPVGTSYTSLDMAGIGSHDCFKADFRPNGAFYDKAYNRWSKGSPMWPI
jgi:hypothetical protein